MNKQSRSGRMLSALGRMLQEVVFPTRCVSCASPESWLCARCLEITGFLVVDRCWLCATPFDDEILCRICTHFQPAFERILVERPFNGPLRHAIHRFKFESGRSLASTLATTMSREIGEMASETAVVPVPLHHNRLTERGYNQSSLLARKLAEEHSLRLAENITERVRDTKSQMNLPPPERRRNVRGAFATVAGVKMPKSVLLVDDVVTTGSTVDECARVLRAAGVEKVTVAAIARAV